MWAKDCAYSHEFEDIMPKCEVVSLFGRKVAKNVEARQFVRQVTSFGQIDDFS